MNKLNLLCFLLLIGCKSSFSIWSLLENSIETNHYLAKDPNQKYFVNGNLKFGNATNLNTSGSILEDCTVTQSSLNNEYNIACLKDGKYKLVSINNCVECPSTFSFRVNKSPKSYYWITEVTKADDMYNLKIGITSIKNEIESENDHDENAVKFSRTLTNFFNSRGECPVIKTLLGKSYTEPVYYNGTEHFWTVSLQSSALDIIPYLHISSKLNTAIFYHSINDVYLFIEPTSSVFDSEQSVKLKGSNEINGHTFSHPCSLHISVLATTDSIYFTQNNFVSTIELTLSSQLIAELSLTNLQVTDIAVYKEKIFIVVQGKVLAAKLSDELFNFELLTGINGTTLSESIKGINVFPVCLMSPNLVQVHAWESNVIVVWSKHNIYFHNVFPNLPAYGNWLVPYDLPTNNQDNPFKGMEIIHLVLGKLPGIVNILAQLNNKLMVVTCSYTTEPTTCSDYEVPLDFPANEWSDIKIKYISNNDDLLIWSTNRIGYLHENVAGWFHVTSVKNVNFNEDNSKFLVQTNDSKLYYGNSISRVLTQLHNVKNSIYQSFKFNKFDVILLHWANSSNLQRQVFPLNEEIYNSAQDSELSSSVCDNTYFTSNLYRNKGNVQNLENYDDKIEVNFTLVHPASINVRISFIEIFNGLVNKSTVVFSQATAKPAGKSELSIHSQHTTIQSSCLPSIETCKTGLASIGISATTEDGKTICSLPLSQVLYINVTCPIGLHIRIRKKSGETCSSFQQDECELIMQKEEMIFFPIIDVYSFDKYLFTVIDDILFHEVNNKSGFELQYKNLILKNCYLCTQLRETNLTSEIILQTAKSACPCKLDMYGTGKWIGNLTFENVLPIAGGPSNQFVFDVKVLGKSFCDLQTRFKLTLLASPLVAFKLWEYVMIIVFVLASLLALAISYHNYIKFMRITKSKLS